MFLLLTEADVRRVLSMRELIDVTADALAAYSTGRATQPLRTVLEVGPTQAYFGVMPAALEQPPAFGAKLVTVFAANAERGLPTHLATIVLNDPDTGALCALLDGRYITEQRTAAASAVSSRLLARPGAGRLAIVGSGVQARSHLEALACVHALSDVRVWSPSPSHRRRFVDQARGRFGDFPVLETESAREAVEGADLVALVTASREPVVWAGWIEPGAHVMAVGACRPDQREMDPELVARGRLYVDSRAGALAEAGDVVMTVAEGRIAPEHVVGELGELVAGRVPGRQREDEVTVFKSLGMAVEDVAAAQLAYRRARERGLGSMQRLD